MIAAPAIKVVDGDAAVVTFRRVWTTSRAVRIVASSLRSEYYQNALSMTFRKSLLRSLCVS
jgi:hypothetical protein